MKKSGKNVKNDSSEDASNDTPVKNSKSNKKDKKKDEDSMDDIPVKNSKTIKKDKKKDRDEDSMDEIPVKESKTTNKNKKKETSDDESEEIPVKESKTKSNYSSNSSSKKPPPVLKYNQLIFPNIEVSALNKTFNQPIAYINYNNDKIGDKTKILVQCEKLKLMNHGIPQLTKKGETGFYNRDSDREFIKIPLDEQPSAIALRAHLEKADDYFGSEKIRKQLFGKHAKDYEYQPCIKTPVRNNNNNDSSEDSDNPKKKSKKSKDDPERPIVDYVKMKFHMESRGDGDDKKSINKTKLVRVIGKTREVIKASSIKEIADHIRWKSEIKFIFYYNKVWANKSKAPGAQFIPYGVGFKIMAIEFTPGSDLSSIEPDNIEFLSEDDNEKNAKLDDSDEMEKPKIKKVFNDDGDETKNKKKTTKEDESKKDKKNSKEDESKKDKSKKKAKMDSSDSEGEIEVKPVKGKSSFKSK